MKAKKILLTSIIATQVLSMTALSAPDEAIKEFKKVAPIKQEVKHFQGEVKLFIIKDGEKVRVDQKMTDGLRVVGGRTCVGVRDLVNAIEGADVEWDAANHIVDITYGGKTISYPVGKPLMWTDGKAVSIDVPAQIDPAISKTFLPIRNIAETLGFKVDWDNKAKEVVLTPGAGKAQTTTAQQPRPTTQTPTQNNKTKITLASGQTVDFNKKIAKGSQEDYLLNASDFIDNGNGVLTFGKGTAFETNLLKRFNRVESTTANPNFRIIGENVGDSRVGTYVIGEGEATWEAGRLKDMENVKQDYMVHQDGQYGNSNITLFKSGQNYKRYYAKNKEKINDLFKDRKIKDEYVKEFMNKKKCIISEKDSKEMAEYDFNKNLEMYDATGIFDAPAIESGNLGAAIYTPEGSIAYYITVDGEYFLHNNFDWINTKKPMIIDKVVYMSTLNHKPVWMVIDLPNIRVNPRNLNTNFYVTQKAVSIWK